VILELKGYSVVESSTKKEAVDQIRLAPIKIVIANAAVPDMVGVELIMRLRSSAGRGLALGSAARHW
jgi:PleD family two-component response regulator